ncbi:hypothetical protein JYB62_13305 [Algoriphagus lutimaris]|uniref:DUF6090 family protein n=1 Tax=Algoriphagus lutimaris TaxID=613197 RepID=UPI00196B3972|nr:DUF6090 family protein [Algoriphagus lutimaris]MBN3520980.1 hypothetical protein [Algoriphagus lutimaris]
MNTKYFKYALGEIILVVIGILIALSINNWSENRKERKFEKKMLAEIQLALENDIDYFNRCIARLERLDSSVEVMLTLIEQKATFVDSMYDQPNQRSYNLATGILYRYNPGPYEALKATGVDKIRNEVLRKELINLYDFEYPRHEEIVKYYDQDYKDQTDRFFAFQSPPFIENRNGERFILTKFPSDLLQKPEFLLLLDDIRARARLELNMFNNFIPEQNSVLKLLKKELEE